MSAPLSCAPWLNDTPQVQLTFALMLSLKLIDPTAPVESGACSTVEFVCSNSTS